LFQVFPLELFEYLDFKSYGLSPFSFFLNKFLQFIRSYNGFPIHFSYSNFFVNNIEFDSPALYLGFLKLIFSPALAATLYNIANPCKKSKNNCGGAKMTEKVRMISAIIPHN
jgi:hypothetical protein